MKMYIHVVDPTPTIVHNGKSNNATDDSLGGAHW